VSSIHCYKYRSAAAALRCLSEQTLYFASPSELNDCLEAKFDHASEDEYANVVWSTFRELALARGDSDTDCRSIPKGLLEDLRPLSKQDNGDFRVWCDQVGIFSAAPRPDNQPMWAYYCDDARGVCFDLEWSKEVMEEYHLLRTPVMYTREARIHNRAKYLRELLLDLGRRNPTWTMEQILSFSMTGKFARRWSSRSIARAVSSKHTDWEHECELRLIAPRAGPIPVMRDVLKGVFFMRTDFPECRSIVRLLSQLYPNVRLNTMEFLHTEPFVRTRQLVPGVVER
jgi:hypothetical protein